MSVVNACTMVLVHACSWAIVLFCYTRLKFLVETGPARRNMLHMAAAAGSTPVLRALERSLRSVLATPGKGLPALRAAAKQALEAKDVAAKELKPLLVAQAPNQA